MLTLLSDLLELLKRQPQDEDEEEEEDVEVVKIANYIKLLQIYLKDKHIKSQGINGKKVNSPLFSLHTSLHTSCIHVPDTTITLFTT